MTRKRGFFHQICPAFKGFKELGDSLDIRHITSLVVDLGNQSVWPLCTHVMMLQHELKHLCLVGTPSDVTATFRGSDLEKRFTEFKGTSISFRNALLGETSIPILASLSRRESVTFLSFDRSKVDFRPWTSVWSIERTDGTRQALPLPLLPSIKRIKYIQDPSTFPLEALETKDNYFVNLFMRGCALTHFELSVGVRPDCCGPEQENESDFPQRWVGRVNINGPQSRTLNTIYNALRKYSRNSLQVFPDNDSATGTFLDLAFFVSPALARRRPPFQQMKVVIVRIKDIQELLDENHYSEKGNCVFASPNRFDSWTHYHSIWRYLSIRYSCFHDCDCVVIETGTGGFLDHQYRLLWRISGEMFANRAVRKVGELRYLIVGNSIEGYRGIEKDQGVDHWIDQSERLCWAYQELETEDCKRVLVVRGFPFRN